CPGTVSSVGAGNRLPARPGPTRPAVAAMARPRAGEGVPQGTTHERLAARLSQPACPRMQGLTPEADMAGNLGLREASRLQQRKSHQTMFLLLLGCRSCFCWDVRFVGCHMPDSTSS